MVGDKVTEVTGSRSHKSHSQGVGEAGFNKDPSDSKILISDKLQEIETTR